MTTLLNARTARAAPLPQGDCRATTSDDPRLPDGAAVMSTLDNDTHHVHVPHYSARSPNVANHGAMHGHRPIEDRLRFAKKSDPKSLSLPTAQSTSVALPVNVIIVDVSVIAHIIALLCADVIVACKLSDVAHATHTFDQRVRHHAAEFVKGLRARFGDGVQLVGVLDGMRVCVLCMCDMFVYDMFISC